MNTPDFRWTADNNMQPNGVGAATFKVGDKLLVQGFASYAEAMSVHEMLCAAQVHGAACGQRALAQLVHGTVHGFLR